MSGKYTPGPWHGEKASSVSRCLYVYSGAEPIAHVYNDRDTALIAAAPDLLESLESLVFRFGSNVDSYGDISKAIAAIAKAKGESHE
jgi:hypothetical protein